MCPLLALPLPRAFLWHPLTVLTRQTRQAVRAINQSIFLRCLCIQHNKPHSFKFKYIYELSQGVWTLTGDNLKLVLVKFSTLSLAVLEMIVTAWHEQAGPHLELKTRPRFYPLSFSVSMVKPGNTKGGSITVPFTSFLTGLD